MKNRGAIGFEYLTLEIVGMDQHKIEYRLGKLGQDGWDLSGVIFGRLLIFKRQVVIR